jgi:hypothetical protein
VALGSIGCAEVHGESVLLTDPRTAELTQLGFSSVKWCAAPAAAALRSLPPSAVSLTYVPSVFCRPASATLHSSRVYLWLRAVAGGTRQRLCSSGVGRPQPPRLDH